MKYKSFFRFLGLSIIVIFLFSYFVEFSGYYEYNLQNKKNLTQGQIDKFEEDVRNGKEIDLNSYLENVSVDYSNSLTRTTSEASLMLNDYLRRFLTEGFNILGKFIK